jgi:signal transduction histidine kinase
MLRENRRLLHIALIAIITLVAVLLTSFYFVSRWEERLIEERKQLCIKYAGTLTEIIEEDVSYEPYLMEIEGGNLSRDTFNTIDAYFTGLLNPTVSEIRGLEGGIYLKSIDDFIGYSFPTSPPPVPVYGPPPRSHKIIRDQALATINSNSEIVNIHAFDPAVFPLATAPVHISGKAVGAVWIRVHIERELPVERLKRIINFTTILFLFGFVVMAIISIFLRSGIKNIRKELNNTRNNPGYRLKRRGGWFGFIPASINEMLNLLEKENHNRLELEKQLQQEEKMASLGRMVAGVAHEVKTPLSVVKTRVQMWEKEVQEHEYLQKKIPPESLKLVLEEIDRLAAMVKRLVVFSRPIHKNLKPTDIDQLLEEVVSFIDLADSKKRIEFSKQLCQKPQLIEADSNSLRQVLINVINNSVESIQDEGLISIHTCYESEKKMATIEISDNGPGIPGDIMDKIFDPFFTLKEAGTGLGLTISHQIVTAHNGTITFQNREQGGVKCTITLPIMHHNVRANGK